MLGLTHGVGRTHAGNPAYHNTLCLHFSLIRNRENQKSSTFAISIRIRDTFFAIAVEPTTDRYHNLSSTLNSSQYRPTQDSTGALVNIVGFYLLTVSSYENTNAHLLAARWSGESAILKVVCGLLRVVWLFTFR